MIVEWNAWLSSWLGDPTKLGAGSWFEIFAWIGGLIAVAIAGIALRRQSLQSRATLLLTLYDRWEAQAGARSRFAGLSKQQRLSLQDSTQLKREHQTKKMRKAFNKAIWKIEQAHFAEIVSYMAFFETLGLYVRRGHLPLADVVALYKEPILQLEICGDFIATWQRQAHMPPGLFEHLLYLVSSTRMRENRPTYYHTIFRLKRRFGRG